MPIEDAVRSSFPTTPSATSTVPDDIETQCRSCTPHNADNSTSQTNRLSHMHAQTAADMTTRCAFKIEDLPGAPGGSSF